MSARNFARALGLALIVATPAFAQTNAPATAAKPVSSAYLPPAASSAPPLPTRTGEPTADQMKLAREVIINSGIALSISASVPQLQDRLYNSIITTRPDLVKDLNATMADLEQEFSGHTEQLLGTISRIYLSQISDADLATINNFFKSDAGKAYVRSQPLILASLAPAMEAWTQKLSADMAKRVREEMKKKGHEM